MSHQTFVSFAGGCIMTGVRLRKKNLILTVGLLLVLGALMLISYKSLVHAPSPDLRTVAAHIDGQSFLLEVADDPVSRAKGLGGRTGLNNGEGMLFVFDTPDIECFWMKDVSFAIDILWFDNNKRLVHMIDRLSPDTYPNSFCPPVMAQYVVELPAGTAAEHGFRSDARLEF